MTTYIAPLHAILIHDHAWYILNSYLSDIDIATAVYKGIQAT